MKSLRVVAVSLVGASILSISGCSLLTRPQDQPVIETKINPKFRQPGKAGTMAITPDRRIAIVNFKTERFCAEGPTEVARDANSIKSLGASFKDIKTTEASIAAILASSSVYNTLNPRSQGLQYLLAASFANCQLYMNDGVDATEVTKLQATVLDKAAQLITAELPYLALQGKTKKELDDLAKSLKDMQALKASFPAAGDANAAKPAAKSGAAPADPAAGK